jgi:hypothetical protein
VNSLESIDVATLSTFVEPIPAQGGGMIESAAVRAYKSGFSGCANVCLRAVRDPAFDSRLAVLIPDEARNP